MLKRPYRPDVATSSTGPENILHVHTLPVVSGSGINTLLTMEGSAARGHRVALATQSEGPLTEKARALGARVHLVGQLRRGVHPIFDPLAVLALRRLIRRESFSIVHTHNSKGGFVGRLAARLARTPRIIHTIHGFAFHDAETRSRRTLYRGLERLAATWCDGLIFVSTPLCEWADREGIARGQPRRIVYSGIDIDRFAAADGGGFRRQWTRHPDTILVGIVAKLWNGKGHDVLLDAWQLVVQEAALPLRLIIVGEGPTERTLRRQVARLGLGESVLFTGFIADVAEATAALDIAVLPSRFEGMGRVVLEAQAAGKPIVASRVGGVPELVENERNGILVPAGDVRALADTLLSLLDDPVKRGAIGQAGRRGMRPEHSSTAMVETIHTFYESLKPAA